MGVTKMPLAKVGWRVEKNEEVTDDRPRARIVGMSEDVNSDYDGSDSADNGSVVVEVPNSPRNLQRLHDPASLVLLEDTEQPVNENDVASDYIITVAKASKGIRLEFLTKVFGILTMQMLVTFCLASYFSFTEWIREYVQTQTWVIWPAILAGLMLYIKMFIDGKKTPLNFLLLTIFMSYLAITIAAIVSFFSEIVVLMAIFALFAVFGCLLLYTADEKYEYVDSHALLIGCLTISLVGSLAEMCSHRTINLGYIAALYGVISLFCVHIIVDISVIMEELSPEDYIFATMTLYTDIIRNSWRQLVEEDPRPVTQSGAPHNSKKCFFLNKLRNAIL